MFSMSETLTIGDVEISGLTPIQKKAMEVLGAGGTMRDIRGLSAEEIETVYSIGFNLYNQAKYAQAEPMFQFACFYLHDEPRYWMALGNCRQMLKKYTPAIDSYGLAYLFDTENPWPPIQTAICYLAMGNKDLAGEALTLAEKALADKPNVTASQRIVALRQAL
jgi:type III secretion system low calcium response chaperone LcrH/SycD